MTEYLAKLILLVIASFPLCLCCREMLYRYFMSSFFLTCEFVIYSMYYFFLTLVQVA